MRGETAIEKHLRLQKQADELAENIDFNACVHVLGTRDLAVTQAKKLFESRGWWKLALSELMESSKQGRIEKEKDDDEYSESTVDSTLQCKSPAVKEETERFVGKDTVDTPKPKKSMLSDTLLSEIVLHKNTNCWQNTPGVHIQRALDELEPVMFSTMNIRSLLKQRQGRFPRLSCSISWRQLAIATLRWTSTRLVACPSWSHLSSWRTSRRCALGVCGLGTRWPLPVDP